MILFELMLLFFWKIFAFNPPYVQERWTSLNKKRKEVECVVSCTPL